MNVFYANTTKNMSLCYINFVFKLKLIDKDFNMSI